MHSSVHRCLPRQEFLPFMDTKDALPYSLKSLKGHPGAIEYNTVCYSLSLFKIHLNTIDLSTSLPLTCPSFLRLLPQNLSCVPHFPPLIHIVPMSSFSTSSNVTSGWYTNCGCIQNVISSIFLILFFLRSKFAWAFCSQTFCTYQLLFLRL